MSRGKMHGGMPRGPQAKFNPNTFKRIIKMLFKFYPVMMPLTVACIIFSAVTAAVPAVFQQKIIADIEIFIKSGDWNAAKQAILPKIFILVGLYAVSIIAITLYNQLIVFMTQGFLNKMRIHMFETMQNLPIKYFDQNKHGDIMSHYTNDVDTMRELVSRSLPSLLQAFIFAMLSMLYISGGFPADDYEKRRLKKEQKRKLKEQKSTAK